MTVRNRLVMSPMETMYGTPDGLPSERTRDYFAARANGGVGLITVGTTGIDHHHPETPGDYTSAPTRLSTPIAHWSRRCTSTVPRSSPRSCTPGPTGWDRRCTA